jgi:hypothetical protein
MQTMAYAVKMLPGLLAALCAFVSIRIATALGLNGLIPHVFLFVGVYLVVIVIADRAMTDYGRRQSDR